MWYVRQVMAIMTYSKGNSCMGIRYAKLFEAAKSMFKSSDSRAV